VQAGTAANTIDRYCPAPLKTAWGRAWETITWGRHCDETNEYYDETVAPNKLGANDGQSERNMVMKKFGQNGDPTVFYQPAANLQYAQVPSDTRGVDPPEDHIWGAGDMNDTGSEESDSVVDATDTAAIRIRGNSDRNPGRNADNHGGKNSGGTGGRVGTSSVGVSSVGDSRIALITRISLARRSACARAEQHFLQAWRGYISVHSVLSQNDISGRDYHAVELSCNNAEFNTVVQEFNAVGQPVGQGIETNAHHAQRRNAHGTEMQAIETHRGHTAADGVGRAADRIHRTVEATRIGANFAELRSNVAGAFSKDENEEENMNWRRNGSRDANIAGIDIVGSDSQASQIIRGSDTPVSQIIMGSHSDSRVTTGRLSDSQPGLAATQMGSDSQWDVEYPSLQHRLSGVRRGINVIAFVAYVCASGALLIGQMTVVLFCTCCTVRTSEKSGNATSAVSGVALAQRGIVVLVFCIFIVSSNFLCRVFYTPWELIWPDHPVESMT
jgi:hypothetical protein